MSCLRFQCLRGGPRFALSAVILAGSQAMRMGVNTKEVVIIDLWDASSASGTAMMRDWTGDRVFALAAT